MGPVAAATPKKPQSRSCRMTEPYDLVEFDGNRIERPDSEWKTPPSPGEFAILATGCDRGSVKPRFDRNHEPGVYYCEDADWLVFRSKAKFDSGTGLAKYFTSRSIRKT
jgi:peptide-methionine (R)-S-oxide reductase